MSIAALKETPQSVQPGTLRHTVVSAAKRFKSTWVELGKLLVEVRDGAKYEEWGYESFEAYCSKELHIRKATAAKLTRSFSFLAKHEPKEVASEDFAQKAPAFEVVEVLAGAEERGQLSADEYRSIRSAIWDEERPTADLRRELGEKFPRPVVVPEEDVRLRRLAAMARKLSAELSGFSKVPRAVADRAGALADDLDELCGRS